jgi:RNA:NAD 2'-phosphotransferase (TPT1/KptA family)
MNLQYVHLSTDEKTAEQVGERAILTQKKKKNNKLL